MVYTDPDGEFWNVVIGAAVGGIIYTGTHLIKEGSFKNWNWIGFGMAMTSGAMVGAGCASCSGWSIAARAGVSQASTYLPSYNVSLGSGFSLNLGVGVGYGSAGWSVFSRIGIGYSDDNFSVGMSYAFGYSDMNHGGKLGRIAEWSSRFSGGVGVSTGNYSAALGTNIWGGSAGNQTGYFAVSHKDWSFSYENDGVPFGGWAGSGTDSYRTAAATISRGEYSVGVRIFTGFRDLKNIGDKDLPTYPYGKVQNKEIHHYLSSPFFIGYKGHRIGWDHYMVGHAFQNIVAHKWFKPQNWIPWKESPYRPNRMYGGFYPSGNPYTDW